MRREVEIENLTECQIKNVLIQSKEDFPDYTELFLSEYAKKLASHANFITLRSEDNVIQGLVCFYSNVKPTAYITHVWVSKSLRGGAIAAK